MKLLSNLGNIDKIHLNWSIRYFTSIYGYLVVIYTSSLKTLPTVNMVWNHNVPAPVSSSLQRLISSSENNQGNKLATKIAVI